MRGSERTRERFTPAGAADVAFALRGATLDRSGGEAEGEKGEARRLLLAPDGLLLEFDSDQKSLSSS